MPYAVIGVDAGGTKTAAALATSDGRVVATLQAGPGNYQSTGIVQARRVYADLVERLAACAHAEGLEVRATAWGLSGLDRPRDEQRLGEVLDEILPWKVPRVLVNDTFLILRAGSPDGVGVAVVSGTGSNCCGVAADGRETRIGGLGWEFGDGSGAGDLGVEATRAAFRGADGRGPETVLGALLTESLGLERLDDIVDLHIVDRSRSVPWGFLAPIVFEAALAGDAVATTILRDAGQDLGLSALLLADRIFSPDDAFPLVLGGSVLQKGRSPLMRDALVAGVHSRFPLASPVVIDAPPLVGALLLALDAVVGHDRPDAAVSARLARALGPLPDPWLQAENP